ncbi:16S rRNA (guanine(966)-N(2))-methyltransferase RsmD [Celerinatantimonas diazotrophica]|uniref:Ribosomal RNA small subunit methyltransferase D n=1 Tax=Celerinatantimonas diazotrophica TaxID=412034 RepID=A0A4R1K3R8_9GAMM|nr:16S rRNA (guanine(966)-N(2))-methyltransferase RsmD [Celerinatantimonas diazotrophica]TCK57629.1 16S rRNA m(2)G-966 methyltransferase [Celerinatantimonas diazotrophica]CAG9298309.1 Ribosomal RNA small subunit methyltransferase D [Celerinatantimonas diazotrophica]
MAQHPKSQTGSIRIIGGQWRGRKLPVLAGEGLRPTTDRVKETLFNWLQGRVANRRCLDLFAGSGSLTFEALSHQADYVVALERFAKAASQLKANQQRLNVPQSKLNVQCVDTLKFLLQKPEQGFDLIFMDPPFRKQMIAPCCDLLIQHGWLNTGAWVYIESEQELDELVVPWQLHRQKSAGQVISRLYQVE